MNCCVSCGAELLDDDLFCAACGTAVEPFTSDLPRPSEAKVDDGDVPVPDLSRATVGSPPLDTKSSVDEIPVDNGVQAASATRPSFCGHCGTPVPDESNTFCVACGRTLESASLSTPIAREAPYSSSSSETMTMSRADWRAVVILGATMLALIIGAISVLDNGGDGGIDGGDGGGIDGGDGGDGGQDSLVDLSQISIQTLRGICVFEIENGNPYDVLVDIEVRIIDSTNATLDRHSVRPRLGANEFRALNYQYLLPDRAGVGCSTQVVEARRTS